MSDLKIPEAYELIESRFIEEMQSNVYELRHKKTKAKVVLASNEDDNKVFTIGFKTLPEDSTGAPHILEHSVLSGSRKYKTKEPFMDLIQGSLQTFLNAMTYKDRTLYPVASRNDQDFKNLMDVYLDAVFFPDIHEQEKIFLQEGWHYEMDDDSLNISGVVYNEMRGAYSDPEGVLYEEITEELFPDTIYANDSGGDPKQVPELSYDELVAFHKKYYHPSNACIVIYGNCDMNERLRYLDEMYLSSFDAADLTFPETYQKPFNEPKTASHDYAIDEGSSTDGKYYYALAYGLDENLNLKESLRVDALFGYLFDESAAPVREKIMAANLGQDFFSWSFNFGQTAFVVGLKQAKAKVGEAFEETFLQALREELEQGLDAKAIEAQLNRIDFNLRECQNYPTRGIIYALNGFEAWVHDESMLDKWSYAKPLRELRDELAEGKLDAFEAAVKRIFDQPYQLKLELVPVPGLNQKNDERLRETLDEKYAQMSTDEREKIAAKAAALKKWQETPDSDEAKATIPQLDPEEVDTNILDFKQEVIDVAGVKVLLQEQATSGTNYLEMALDISDAPFEDLSKIRLWTVLLGELDAADMDYRELQQAINLETGGIDTNVEVVRQTDGGFKTYLRIGVKTLEEKWASGLELVRKVLLETKFEQAARMRELLIRHRINVEQQFANRGDSASSLRTEAYLNPAAAVEDKIVGFAYYEDLCELLDHWDEREEDFRKSLAGFAKTYARSSEMTLSLTGTSPKDAAAELETLINALSSETMGDAIEVEPLGALNEGIIVPSQVQYVALRFDFDLADYPYDGSWQVVRQFLTNTYLHNQIRAIGGAYGYGLKVQRTGSVVATSFRDPRLVGTLQDYKGTGDFLAETELDETAVERSIIGSVNHFDPPMTPQGLTRFALNLQLRGDSVEEIRDRLGQALQTTAEDFRSLAPLFAEGFKEKSVCCVVGGREAILEAKDTFDHIMQLNEHGLHEVELS